MMMMCHLEMDAPTLEVDVTPYDQGAPHVFLDDPLMLMDDAHGRCSSMMLMDDDYEVGDSISYCIVNHWIVIG